ncbi:hypothetical protein [Gemmatimonas sp.]|uniref:hypothetical protein n=1 Tax=Gemmatimonas sp. TaxID=1962908 RepID=UPI0039839364
MPRCHRLATLLLAISALSAASLCAQPANPLVGTWTVEYEMGRRVEDGQVTSITGTGTLKVEASGDSLVGLLQAPLRPDGSVVPVATLGGRAAKGTAVLNQKASATMNMNGEITTIEVTVTWTLQASGDTLTGTLLRALPPGIPAAAEPSPVTGTRVKG